MESMIIKILDAIFLLLLVYLFVLAIVLLILGIFRHLKILREENLKGIKLIGYYLDSVFGDVTSIPRKKIYLLSLVISIFVLIAIVIVEKV